MVLYKRKPVQFLPPIEISSEETEVWYIPETGEVFVSYEEYLHRMDFYKQRRFNDQITGQSGMTFFEAHKSEQTGGEEVEAAFPEALKGPVLRRVQFQTISRLDNMVDQVFHEFKGDFYPGEEVMVAVSGGAERATGLVRDKTSFGPRITPDGTRLPPMSRYMVLLKDSQNEVTVDDDHIARDRGIFTKAMLRSFIKRTTIREAWNGAPWLVKHDFANQFHIDTRIPSALRYDTKLDQRKQQQAQKRASHGHEINGDTNGDGPMRLPDLKPTAKSHKGRPPLHGDGKSKDPTPPPPPPPQKYPMEDLEIMPQPEPRVRPFLKYLCKSPPYDGHENDWRTSKIDMESVGLLLETWDTLNVYCEIFHLDSFTFDDFVEAMLVASEQVPVQLFDEIHCSVLKVLVDSTSDGGKVRIALPDLDEEESDEEEEEEDEEEPGTRDGTPEPAPKPAGRATRSSLAKQEAERIAAEAAREEEEIDETPKHRAEELVKDFDWIEHLRVRDFQNGGWEMIMVGLLHQLSRNPRKEKVCEELLLQLVPGDVEPSQESIRQTYTELDINGRIKALQIICMLTMETKLVRGYMEECSDTMTKYRKDKIEWQRLRKQGVAELIQLNEQRKILLPDNMPPSPSADEVKVEEEDVKMADADDTQPEEENEDSDEDVKVRTKRRRSDKQQKRDEVKERKEKEKEEKLKKAAPKGPTQSKEFIKLLKEITKKEEEVKKCEEEVAVIDNDLREADCPRTRVLGKDRFWNRYYWFERNGMPYGGLPTSSTAEAGYANGCIWVQGPDDIEREGYVDLEQQDQERYVSKFRMTVPERKAREEGKTHVHTARQWGYIDEPADLEKLIRWLDSRGIRELKLRKELLNYRQKIADHMEKRKAYLQGSTEQGDKEEAKRTSTRIRDKTPEPPNYKCLVWENTTALEEFGYLHSEPPPPPRSRKQTKKRDVLPDPTPPPPPKTRRR